MLVATPKDLRGSPFQLSKYQRPRDVMYVRSTSKRWLRGCRVDGALQRDDRRMMAELQDVVDAFPGLDLELVERIEVGDRRHQRLLADDVATEPQSGGDVGSVEVVGAAYGDVVQRSVGIAAQVVGVLVEALELDEEVAVRADRVDDAHGVVRVVRRHERVPGLLDGAHVARRDVAGGADEGEALHGRIL